MDSPTTSDFATSRGLHHAGLIMSHPELLGPKFGMTHACTYVLLSVEDGTTQKKDTHFNRDCHCTWTEIHAKISLETDKKSWKCTSAQQMIDENL